MDGQSAQEALHCLKREYGRLPRPQAAQLADCSLVYTNPEICGAVLFFLIDQAVAIADARPLLTFVVHCTCVEETLGGAYFHLVGIMLPQTKWFASATSAACEVLAEHILPGFFGKEKIELICSVPTQGSISLLYENRKLYHVFSQWLTGDQFFSLVEIEGIADKLAAHLGEEERDDLLSQGEKEHCARLWNECRFSQSSFMLSPLRFFHIYFPSKNPTCDAVCWMPPLFAHWVRAVQSGQVVAANNPRFEIVLPPFDACLDARGHYTVPMWKCVEQRSPGSAFTLGEYENIFCSTMVPEVESWALDNYKRLTGVSKSKGKKRKRIRVKRSVMKEKSKKDKSKKDKSKKHKSKGSRKGKSKRRKGLDRA